MSASSASDRRQRDLYLDGQLLVAMPAMGDPRFARSVIYLCAHSADGAMGKSRMGGISMVATPPIVASKA